MPGGGGARILRTLVAGRGQDVRVEGRGVHLALVPKREGYISLFCLDAHPTPSPASSAHLEDARLDAHLRILVGFPPPLGLDAGWHGCRRSCVWRSPRPQCLRRLGRSFTAAPPHAREIGWGKFPQAISEPDTRGSFRGHQVSSPMTLHRNCHSALRFLVDAPSPAIAEWCAG